MMDKKDISQSPSVIVVEASAGSGKTYQLAKRYLHLLINPALELENIPLRHILAITFTNKAAVEMKERIIEFLKRIAFDDFTDKDQERDIYDSLGVEKGFAREKAGLIMDELIQHYSFFQVQTIDSFINALLLGCALRIDRSASFQIRRDYIRHLSYCLDLVIEQASGDRDVLKLLQDFLKHYLFVENQKGWFPREDILKLMVSLFRLSNSFGSLFSKSSGRSADVIKKKRELFKKIKELAQNFPEGMDKRAKTSIINFIEKNDEIFEISNLPKRFEEKDVPMNRGKVALPEYEKEWRGTHHLIKKLIELDADAAYSPYIELFYRFLDFFQGITRKEDVLFLEELNKKAMSLFGDGGVTVAELYYRMATRFRHYLIDEFQDTSKLQWHNLRIMVEEALSTGGSLFYVGDKKQAIYRFRGGESGLFDEIKEEFRHFNLIQKHLTKNWRSQKAIVDFNNQVFSKNNLSRMLNEQGIASLLPAKDEITGAFQDAVQEYREGNEFGYVSLERIDEKNQEERNEIVQEKLLKLIRELKERFRLDEIAVLTRDNEEVELVTSWLLNENIPVESEKTLNILENPLIKELVAFLQFLHSPIDDLSFSAFILGELFSKVCGVSQNEMQDFLFTLHKKEKGEKEQSLYSLFRQEYPKIWDKYMDEFFRNVGFVSLYEMLVSIYQRFGLMKKFPDDQAFFTKFLELIKEREDEYVGLGEFLNYLKEAPAEDLYVNVTKSDSIKVLTIHKAKGLEFSVVIVPFLRMSINPAKVDRNLYVIEGFDGDPKLVRITNYHCTYSERLQAVYAEAYKKAFIDELNSIYVALTRARYELYVFIPNRSGNAKNMAKSLIPEYIKEEGAKKTYPRKEREEPAIKNIPPSKYQDWIGLLRDEFGEDERITNRQKILQGNIMHAMLSAIENCRKGDPEEMLRRGLVNARILFSFIHDFSEYETKVRKLIHKKEMERIFFISDGDVFCEKEVINKFGDTKRMDRLIVKKNEIWIIDYKSTRDNEKIYKKQIKEYMKIVKEIYPKQKIKGFLIYLDDLSIEAVDGK